MWETIIPALIGGIGSWLGGEKQADAAGEATLLQQMLLGKAAKNLTKAYQGVIDDIASNPSGYAGTRVKPALYEPVNIEQSQRGNIQGNLNNLDLINQLVSGSNRATTANDIARILNFDPQALSTLGNLSDAANMWSSGRLPTDAIEDIVSNSATRYGSANTPGGAAPATLRDLGLSSMDAQSRGASLFQQILQSAEAISPVSRQVAAPQFFITPQQGLQTDLQQALLMQQSQQNANNLNAAPDPALNLMAQLKLQSANTAASIRAGGASLVQPNMTPYASIYGQLGNAVGQAVGGFFGGGGSSFGGGFSSGFGGGFNPAAYNNYAMNYNWNAAPGTAPKAYVV